MAITRLLEECNNFVPRVTEEVTHSPVRYARGRPRKGMVRLHFGQSGLQIGHLGVTGAVWPAPLSCALAMPPCITVAPGRSCKWSQRLRPNDGPGRCWI